MVHGQLLCRLVINASLGNLFFLGFDKLSIVCCCLKLENNERFLLWFGVHLPKW